MLANALRSIYKSFEVDLVFCNRAELNITDLDAVVRYFKDHNFDFVINCAAYTQVERAETDIESAYAVNKTGAKNVAIAAHTTRTMLVHISTDAVYDGTKSGIYYESDTCNPLSVYSRSKYEGELEILKEHNFGIIVRTSWLYSLDKPNFVTTIVNNAKADGRLNVVCDQLGTPTYTYDLADAILKMIVSGKINAHSGIEIYHYSNEGAISWYDFAVGICRSTGIHATIYPVSTAQYPSKVTRPFQTIMSKNKIKQSFDLVIPYWMDSLERCLGNNKESFKMNFIENKNIQ